MATANLRSAKWSVRWSVSGYGYITLVVENALKLLWGLNVSGWHTGWHEGKSVSQCVSHFFAIAFTGSDP